MTMKLQFAHQDYQKKAVDAVVKVFDGQPLAKGDLLWLCSKAAWPMRGTAALATR